MRVVGGGVGVWEEVLWVPGGGLARSRRGRVSSKATTAAGACLPSPSASVFVLLY